MAVSAWQKQVTVRQMLVASVLVGRYKVVDPDKSLTRPPEGYDSVAGLFFPTLSPLAFD